MGRCEFATFGVMYWRLAGEDSHLSSRNEKRCLQHLESCTEVCLGKTLPLLIGKRKDVCNIWSHALEFR